MIGRIARGFLLSGALIFASTFQLTAQPASTEGIVLEIVTGAGRPPVQMPLGEKCPCGVWVTQFDRIGGGRTKDNLPIRAVKVLAGLSDRGAGVRISAFTGKEQFEYEEFVTESEVDSDSESTIDDVRRVGVGPLRLRLVRVSPVVAPLPTLENETQSVGVTIEPLFDTLPSAMARIVNHSNKPIMGLSVWTSLNDKMISSSMPHGNRGEVLIPPGGQYFFRVSMKMPEPAQAKAVYLIRSGASDIKFHVGTVLFQDGTFEGSGRGAETFKGFDAGRRIQLKVLLPILREASGALSERGDIAKVIEKVKRSRIELDERSIRANSEEFLGWIPADVHASRKTINVSTAGVVRQTVSTLEYMAAAHISAGDLRTGLNQLIAEYETWLGRLSR